jgi:hypothetical protein
MICVRTLLRINEKESNPKKLKNKKFLATQVAPRTKEFCFWGITPQPKIGICTN